MSQGSQLSRQWHILQFLLKSHRPITAFELLKKVQEALGLSWDVKTIRRDISALIEGGFPIEWNSGEKPRRYRLDKDRIPDISMQFNVNELLALYFSRDILQIFRDTIFYNSLEKLIKGIEKALPETQLKYAENFREAIHTSLAPYSDYSEYQETIDKINRAIMLKKRIYITYSALSAGEETSRKVDPYKIWLKEGRFYLIGMCHLRKETRIFTLRRIKRIALLEENFKEPGEPGDHLDLSFGVFQGRPVLLKILFSSKVAEYITERQWHPSQLITRQPDGAIIFEAEMPDTVELKSWIMSWGIDAEVLEPSDLREKIRDEIEVLRKRYGMG